MKRITAFVLFVGLVVPSLVSAYTSPGRPVGFVNDFADVLSSETEEALNGQLTAFARDESNEISVVTIASLEGDTIENFAVQLFKEWGIGKAKQDNGVLLLIAPNDREARIEVGYGLEGALTDLETKLIIEQTLIPGFREGNYNNTIVAAVGQMVEATKGEYAGESPKALFNFLDKNSDLFYMALLFVFFGLGEVLGAMIRTASRSRAIWPGGAVGGIGGLALGGLIGVALGLLVTYIIGGLLVGVLIDYLLSRNKKVSEWGKNLGRGGSGGSRFFFGTGGRGGGGGFGGFGGGLSGGGGSSGRW